MNYPRTAARAASAFAMFLAVSPVLAGKSLPKPPPPLVQRSTTTTFGVNAGVFIDPAHEVEQSPSGNWAGRDLPLTANADIDVPNNAKLGSHANGTVHYISDSAGNIDFTADRSIKNFISTPRDIQVDYGFRLDYSFHVNADAYLVFDYSMSGTDLNGASDILHFEIDRRINNGIEQLFLNSSNQGTPSDSFGVILGAGDYSFSIIGQSFEYRGTDPYEAAYNAKVGWNFRANNQGGPVIFSHLASSDVPEPTSWALMLGGFGLVGGALRSSRRKAIAASN